MTAVFIDVFANDSTADLMMAFSVLSSVFKTKIS